MLSMKLKPKWLACLIPITLSLATLGTLGCSSDSGGPPAPPEPLNHEAGIANISVSMGTMLPAFDERVNNYGVTPFYADPTGFAVTVTLKDESASLTIDGRPATSGQAMPITLADGLNRIQIATVSEDKRTTRLASIMAQKMALNTTVRLNSNGANFEGAVLQICTTNDVVLAEVPVLGSPNSKIISPQPTQPQGAKSVWELLGSTGAVEVTIGLDPSQRYNLYVKGPEIATVAFRNVTAPYPDQAGDDLVLETMVEESLGADTPGFSSEPPIITKIQFANSNVASPPGGWRSLPDGVFTATGTRESFTALMITAVSENPITTELGMTTPMIINVNGPAFEQVTGTQTGTVVETAERDAYNGKVVFRTSYRFSVPLGYMTNAHKLNISVRDMLGNRGLQTIDLTTTQFPPSQEGDANISGLDPKYFYQAQSQVYGVTQNSGVRINLLQFRPNPNVTAVEVTGTLNLLLWALAAAGLTSPSAPSAAVLATMNLSSIRGYEVWRSAGNSANYQLIDTVNFVGTSNGLTAIADYGMDFSVDPPREFPAYVYFQMFQYYDVLADANTEYYYKIRPFNGNPANGGYAPESNALYTRVLPSFVTNLATPAHNAMVNTLWPSFRFEITEPSLFSMADDFYTTLYVKDMIDTNNALFNANIRINWTIDEQGDPLILYWDELEQGWYQAVYNAGTAQVPNWRPFIRMENNGAIVVDTDNPEFKTYLACTYAEGTNEEGVTYTYRVPTQLYPGMPYEWNVYGYRGGIMGRGGSSSATNAAYFVTRYFNQPGAPGVPTGNVAADPVHPLGALGTSFSLGRRNVDGLGAINGFTTFVVSPDAK